MLIVNAQFAAHYDLNPLEELPASVEVPRCYYPGADSVGGRDGVIVEVTPSARGAVPWIGIFAFGLIAPRASSGIFTCPNPEKFCVIARGDGYIVAASNPKTYEHIKIEPVLAVYPVPSLNLLLFAGLTRVAGYGPEGLAWRTQDLSWDGLRSTEIEGHELRGKSWSSPENRWVDFVVDLTTGRHEGGARPP